MYKISIILPIFNVENLLERALNSIINQTMELKDIEVIMVDDCSTDGSKKIMEKYSSKYSNFISLYHEKNSGGCGFPRNTGLEVASGEYVIFFDSDDELLPDNCQKLYDAIKKYDCDVAFGRYERRYSNNNKIEISYSPFFIDFDKYFPKDKFDNVSSSKNSNFIRRFINYYKNKKIDKNHGESIEMVYVESIKQNFDLMKIAPSVWTKMYRREFLIANNFKFQQEAAEDGVFVLNTFNKANGIIFLNNFAGYVYYRYGSQDNKSMTNNVSFKLLDEISSSYITCSTQTREFPKNIRSSYINSQIFNWFSLWRNSNLNKEETNYLLNKLKKLKNEYDVGLKTKLLFSFIINFIKISSYL